MSKVFCVLSFLAMCAYAHFDKHPDLTSATIQLVLAVTFSAALVVVAKSKFEALLD